MNAASDALLAPGVMLAGKYRLERLLGQGGMGSVWLAENVDIGRQVAIKFLLPDCASDPEMLTRFRMEARAAAAIGHPGIVDVLDLGRTSDGGAFIVMESLSGETLGSRIHREGPLPVATVLWVLDQVADALAAAHEKEVVHRDLKPDNLFIVVRPVAAMKILDFGISKFRAQGDVALTRTGMVMGTPLYMSPEQARGSKSMGPATDLYSLGAILFHALTGRPPFLGDNYNEVIAQVLTVPAPSMRLSRGDVPEPLAALVDALLAKEPAARPASARAVREVALTLLGAGPAPVGTMNAAALDSTAAGPISRRPPPAPAPPVWHPGVAPSDALDQTSPSQRRPSGDVPLPAPLAASPVAPDALASTSPSQRRPSQDVPVSAAPAAKAAPPPPERRSKAGLIGMAVGGLAGLLGIFSGAAAHLLKAPPLPQGARISQPPEMDSPAPAPAPVVVAPPVPAVVAAPVVAPQARVSVIVSPASSRITLDPGGACPLPCAVQGTPGSQIAVTVEHEGFLTSRRTVTLGEADELRIPLERAPVAVRPAGFKAPTQSPAPVPVAAPAVPAAGGLDDIDRGR